MGSSQSNTILTSEIAATGIILLAGAGAYFFTSKPQSSNNNKADRGQAVPGAGKHGAKNKRKRKEAKGNANTRPEVVSSIDTLVAEPRRSNDAAGTSKVCLACLVLCIRFGLECFIRRLAIRLES